MEDRVGMGAVAGRARRVLARQAVAEKSDEIAAIPDLLGLLDLEGAVASIDAMGCQKAIAQTIVDGGADYVLALKDNRPTSCEDVRLWLDTRSGARAPDRAGNGGEGLRPDRNPPLCPQRPDRLAGGETRVGRPPGGWPGRAHPHHRRSDRHGLPLFPALAPGSGPVRRHRERPLGD